MEKRLKDPSAEVVITCLEDRLLKNEVMLNYHCFVRILSGGLKVVLADNSMTFGPGDTILFPRRQLSTIIQYPMNELPYKCLLIILKDDRIKDYYSRHKVDKNAVHSVSVHYFEQHPLLESFFNSLLPYFDMQGKLPESLLGLKIDEAITILRILDKDADALLGNLSEPDKIDLAGFMEQNYIFNMPIAKFSYLTGRSLPTFKRDFKKLYGMPPQRWLTEKRLKLAHYLLAEKQKKPVEVFREAGFENLSHFSYAFKRRYGYAPTEFRSVI
ncbi:helix-turn-helix domain-containing protein [Mucilaginibacter sp. UR6-1]|uniref:AraC family transcriptional regulator n=1 Tax=Mucilaginibacter sp. UR6-1 TaxID=1435643 RepID=UPI001E49D568|nr:helix-turn-helix domain-containing protein [Mucilaginibacter sp. UR6-1]MCC8408261.1 helix-turn-helix domain-containing protein [Mucilaginibacter sp. UR6-1]